MAMKVKSIEYGAPATQILATPDHYVAFGYRHEKATAGAAGLATLVEGRYVVKAGTIYPANDATAIGVVLNDYDVNDGDAMLAVVVHGFIKIAALPDIPASAAISAMKNITFMPLTNMGITLAGTKATVTAGTETDPAAVTFVLSGATFRSVAGAETLANWTIAGESTTKITVTAIDCSDDLKTVKFTFDQSAAAVAGNVTVIPDPEIISTGKTMSAVTIATVS